MAEKAGGAMPKEPATKSKVKYHAVAINEAVIEKFKPYQQLYGATMVHIVERALDDFYNIVAVAEMESTAAIQAARKPNVVPFISAAEKPGVSPSVQN